MIRSRDKCPISRGIHAVWCYGVVQLGGLPTHGQVCFSKDMQLRWIWDDRDAQPEGGMFEEKRLRVLLTLLNTASPCNGTDYNPLLIVRIVNVLQPLGKKKALAVMSICALLPLGTKSHARGLFLFLRVLFDAPMPCMHLGISMPFSLVDLKMLRRFPIVLATLGC